MTSTFEWKLRDGRNARIVGVYTETIEQDISYSDGWNIPVGTKVSTFGSEIAFYVEDKLIGKCEDKDFWKLIDVTKDGLQIKKVWGLLAAFTDSATADRYSAWVDALIAGGKCSETIAQEQSKQDADIANAQEIIAAAEHTVRNTDGSLMTNAQAKAWCKGYNNINNEGGEGFVPEVITREQYDHAINKERA